MHIIDPCMPKNKQEDRAFLIACYLLHLAQGSTLLCRSIKSGTLTECIRAAAKLCVPTELMDPRLDKFGRKSEFIEKMLHKCKRWELMADRQEPVTAAMLDYIIDLADKDSLPDYLLSAMADWLVLGKYTGFRISEWAQYAKDVKKEKFGRAIDGSLLALIFEDLTFFGEKERRLPQGRSVPVAEKDTASMDVCWSHQKNNDNGQKIRFSKNRQKAKCCAVGAGTSIRTRAQRLKVKKGHPIAVYKNKSGKLCYTTDEDIEHILQLAAQKV